MDRLEALGYAQRTDDDADRRRKLIRLTPRGIAALTLSAMIFSDIHVRWARTLGPARLGDLEASLRTMVPAETFRLDVPGWFGAVQDLAAAPRRRAPRRLPRDAAPLLSAVP